MSPRHYARDALEIDLVRLCRHAGARLILDAVTGIDREVRAFHLRGRGPVAYDVASLNIGITARMDLPGFAEHARTREAARRLRRPLARVSGSGPPRARFPPMSP